ncbi:maleylpyruvate isomerase N-terminal domain-containing protein [Actinoplanes oblitus]|uniref:Maleylpyruvate isomerase N-terminal domain-containing protein n=1 Tax=Actinoplanes oblitus TaxID=3040509 RepID=A0ABY8WPF8_9ACTN|nr:maleylpyruvate isomerase N-terminal domain-containing protein [Actinoplanes oblitus]WIM99761.1 maleylpyruvate isomerase N-terminal domain-containing protein [Actinoplanes oblitus]
MRIGPRYGSDPLIVLDGDPAAVVAPLLGQRRRLADTLAGFDEAAWSAQSRCTAWSNRDVVVHLTITNRFWTHSIVQARLGRPTRMLADFDPVQDPDALVRAVPPEPVADTLAAFRSTTEALADCLAELSPQEWTWPAESPLGHVPVTVLAHHALWDGWVHERDIAAGVDARCVTVDDEVRPALRFVAAFAAALDLVGATGAARPSRRAAVVTVDPDVAFTVEVNDQVRVTDGVAPGVPVALRGRTTDVLEGLSVRAPLPVDAEYRWLTDGLQRTFEAAADPRA